MLRSSSDVQPSIQVLELMGHTLSFVFLRMALLHDICIGMLNLFIGRLCTSLLPKIPHKNLTGKTCLITGGNSGIGLSIAKQMATRGCNVWITSRNADKGKAAVEEVEEHLEWPSKDGKEPRIPPKIEVLELDNAGFASVRDLVDQIEKENMVIDYLFLNAGFPGAASNNFTDDGHELTYQTNFLSSFLMTRLMLERNLLAEDAQLIFTASTGQYGGAFSSELKLQSTKGEIEPGFHGPLYTKSGLVNVNPSSRYANTKLMQVVFTKLLQRHFESNFEKLGSSLMSAHVFTPSYCSTPIFGKTDSPSPFNDPLFWFLVTSTKIAVPVEEGAAAGVFLALKDGIESGGYWDRCVRRVSNADVMSEDMQKKLWDRWCRDSGVEWEFV